MSTYPPDEFQTKLKSLYNRHEKLKRLYDRLHWCYIARAVAGELMNTVARNYNYGLALREWRRRHSYDSLKRERLFTVNFQVYNKEIVGYYSSFIFQARFHTASDASDFQHSDIFQQSRWRQLFITDPSGQILEGEEGFRETQLKMAHSVTIQLPIVRIHGEYEMGFEEMIGARC